MNNKNIFLMMFLCMIFRLSFGLLSRFGGSGNPTIKMNGTCYRLEFEIADKPYDTFGNFFAFAFPYGKPADGEGVSIPLSAITLPPENNGKPYELLDSQFKNFPTRNSIYEPFPVQHEALDNNIIY